MHIYVNIFLVEPVCALTRSTSLFCQTATTIIQIEEKNNQQEQFLNEKKNTSPITNEAIAPDTEFLMIMLIS